MSTAQGKSRRLTPIDWVICGVACFGFAFDTYELLPLTLTVQPALTEFLTAKPGSAEFNHRIGWMFYIPAIAGAATRQLGYAAGIVGFLAYAAGSVASFWLPEPPEKLITE